MDAHDDLATIRLIRFLQREPVVWLSTVGTDGAPHLVPTWFTWDGTAVTIVSKAGARKARDIGAESRVMLALGDPDDDFDVAMVEARGEILPEPTPLELPAGFAAKYAARIRELGLTPAQFARCYPTVIRITSVKALGWHGRTTPRSVTAAGSAIAARRYTSIAEPVRNSLRGLFGEALGRPIPSL